MISVVVLAKNDGKNIIPTLESVKWCDEIIVIDDKSTDDTVKVAERYTDKIFTRLLNDDYSAQRNYGLDISSGEWVLFVDSDEVVSGRLKKEIINCVTKANCEISGYYLKRTDYFGNRNLKHGETANTKLLRLARRDAERWERPGHEIWQTKGQCRVLQNPLEHYPHPNIAQFWSDIDKYSTINAKYLYRQKVNVYWFHIIVYPLAKFLVNYVFRLGFLDGTEGAIMAIMMSFHSFSVRAKLYLLKHKDTQKVYDYEAENCIFTGDKYNLGI